jgi:hypothetical protein
VKKIVLLSGNHICHNPRVVKEADALVDLGIGVQVVGGATSAALKEKDRKVFAGRKWGYEYAYDLTKGGPGCLAMKLQRKAGELAFRGIGWANPWQISYGTGKILAAAREKEADLTIAHWDPALPAAVRLLREGKQVGVDMEDWFSGDVREADQRRRPLALLQRLEKRLLCEGRHSSCPSEAMADALVEAYGCPRPTVIRNVFPIKDREQLDGKWKDRPGMRRWMPSNDPQAARPKEAPVSIHWFSQTIGPGRGLETLFQALDGLEGNWELHLRGNLKGYEGWLEGVCPASVKGRLKVHGLVENEQLLSRIAEHDIGFCGEPKFPPNKNLTISNKFFQYLQGGLAVIASDTVGQKEAGREAGGAVELFPGDASRILQGLLQKRIEDRYWLASLREQAWEAGKTLCWENEARRLAPLAGEMAGR